MKIRIWGARGSVPAPGGTTYLYGGNTSCVAVEVAPGDALVWANLGDNSVKLGDPAQARTAYEKVIALKPDASFVKQAKEGLADLDKKKPKPKKK